MLNNFNEKLIKLEEALDLKPIEMAEIGNCSRSTYYRYRNGETKPDVEFLLNILNNEKYINPDWLLRDHGPILKLKQDQSKMNRFVHSENVDVHDIPFYTLKISESNRKNPESGDGLESPERYLPLSSTMVKEVVDGKPERLFALKVDTDAMNPVIEKGSIVLADRRQNEPDLDAIYVVKFDNILRINALQRLPGNKLRISSENPRYKSHVIDLNQEIDFEILGKVIWMGKKLY